MVSARGLSSLLAISYVGSVYLLPGARESFRDDFAVLWRRVAGVLAFTLVTVCCYGEDWETWAGFHGEDTLRAIVKSVVLLHMLYMAPLLAKGYPSIAKPKSKTDKLILARDYIIGPVTEELVYRALIVSVYRADGLSPETALRENFLYFGISHVHHALMRWLGGESTFRQAVANSIKHFIITSLFGTYACYLLIRTGSIWPSIVSHMLCNLFGPPALSNGQIWYVPALVAGLWLWIYSLNHL